MYNSIWLIYLLTCPSVKSLSILLPLWSWPTENWASVFAAIEASNTTTWQVIINPNSGPDTIEDHPSKLDYVNGLAQLSSHPNVIITGYARTQYTQIPIETVKAQVNTYASWNTYQSAKLRVDGIFFDEVSGKDAGTPEVLQYYSDLSTHVKSQFPGSATKSVIFNPGALGPVQLFDVCDTMIEFEGWAKEYNDVATIATFPSDKLGKVGIWIYNSEALGISIESAVNTMAAAGVGTVFFDYGYCGGSEGKPTGCYKTFEEDKLRTLAAAVVAH